MLSTSFSPSSHAAAARAAPRLAAPALQHPRRRSAHGRPSTIRTPATTAGRAPTESHLQLGTAAIPAACQVHCFSITFPSPLPPPPPPPPQSEPHPSTLEPPTAPIPPPPLLSGADGCGEPLPLGLNPHPERGQLPLRAPTQGRKKEKLPLEVGRRENFYSPQKKGKGYDIQDLESMNMLLKRPCRSAMSC
jgi:hypothetical protein